MGVIYLHLVTWVRTNAACDAKALYLGSSLGLGNITITIYIAIDTWSVSIENTLDRMFDNLSELRQKQVICERRNTVRGPVAGREIYARNSV